MKSILPSALFLFLLILPMAGRAQEQSLPRLQTNGNQFETVDGNSIALRGVSLCSLEWHKPLEQIASVSAWKPNIIRLPVQPKEWKRGDPANYLKDRLDPAVALCKKQNLYCIIDWHEIGDWDKPEKIKTLEEFWKIVAPRYSANPNILYEVFNEPVGPKAKTKENWMAWKETMQGWVDMIRADAPNTVLLIGSPHWSQMPGFAVENPLRGDNLAYVMHLYPNYKPASWDKAFGDAANSIPIFLSEWGWTQSEKAIDVIQGTQKSFGDPLKDYLNARPHIGWTAWSYDPKCAPAMLGRDADMGAFVKEWLSEPLPQKAD